MQLKKSQNGPFFYNLALCVGNIKTFTIHNFIKHQFNSYAFYMIDKNAFDISLIDSSMISSSVIMIGKCTFNLCKNFQQIEFQSISKLKVIKIIFIVQYTKLFSIK